MKKEELIIESLLKVIKVARKQDVFASRFLKFFDSFIVWGGFPAVVLAASKKEKQKILNDLYNTYVLKDIKGLLELATDRNLMKLAEFLAGQVGNLLVYQNLSRISQLDYRKLMEHLTILKETYVIDTVSPFYTNVQKELAKIPKVYFLDTGLRNILLQNAVGLSKRPDAGSLVENYVYVKLKNITEDTVKINFWRTKAGAEVDFVLRYEGEIVPIEVKFGKGEGLNVTKSFLAFLHAHKPKRGLVLTRDYYGFKDVAGCKVLFWPVYLF